MKKITLLFALCFSFAVQAQLIFQDDFSSYTTNTELSGQGLWSNSPIAPNVGIGACLPLSSSSTCSGSKVLDQAISYLNFGSSSKAIEIGPYRDGVAHIVNPAVTSGDFYVGMVLNLNTAPLASASPVDFMRVINGDATQVCFRLIVKDAGFGYNIGIRKGASANATVYTDDLYNYGENVLVIIKYSHLDGFDDDVVRLYVNPDFAAGEPLNPNVFTATGFDQSGNIDRVAFRLNFNVPDSMPTGFAGLVSAATNWQGLGFLPLATNSFEANALFASTNNTNNHLEIQSKNNLQNVQLTLYAAQGNMVEKQRINIASGNTSVQLKSKLSTGLYVLTLKDENGFEYRQKIMFHN